MAKNKLTYGGIYGKPGRKKGRKRKGRPGVPGGVGGKYDPGKGGLQRQGRPYGTRVEDYRAPYDKSFGVGSGRSGSEQKNLGH